QEVRELADVVLATKGRTGGGNARNLGLHASSGNVIAWLDDDDTWEANKIQRQLDALRASPDPERVVLSGRQEYLDQSTGTISRPGPSRLIQQGEAVEHYLFRNRAP